MCIKCGKYIQRFDERNDSPNVVTFVPSLHFFHYVQTAVTLVVCMHWGMKFLSLKFLILRYM